ncbi:Hypothetical predicted protein [Octopus vulgaris]|uniref:Uncharacterized protein n=1 Tax=Octopus vulgaris TaxID=6645 RepID=A0AA36B7A2_OCTVU|nr:Hypothetical predicted protein [Octopus vulgaris]
MGRKCDFSASQKSISAELSKSKSKLEISKIIGIYHQTVKKFATAPTKIRKRADKGFHWNIDVINTINENITTPTSSKQLEIIVNFL